MTSHQFFFFIGSTSYLNTSCALLYTQKLCTAFNNFPRTPYTRGICHILCRSIVSCAFSKSINVQNTSFQFVRYFSDTCLTASTWSMHILPCLKPHCSSPIAPPVSALTLIISHLPAYLPLSTSTSLVATFTFVTQPFVQGHYTCTTPIRRYNHRIKTYAQQSN